MVVVEIKIYPGGDESKARTIGLVTIINDGTGTQESGNYDVHLSHSGKFWGRPGSWKLGRVMRHRRGLSPYHLVLAALKAALRV